MQMNTSLSDEELGILRLIDSLIQKQHALLPAFRAVLGKNTSVYSMKKNSPDSISVLGESWAIAVHGVGVRFSNVKSGEVVDVHVGVFDSENAFDAWRLESYANSISYGECDFKRILDQLAAKKFIQNHKNIPMHYELIVSGDQV
jgi:hypothetical protein